MYLSGAVSDCQHSSIRQKTTSQRHWQWILLALIFCVAGNVQAASEGGWLLFPQLEYADWPADDPNVDHGDGHGHERGELSPAVDVFFSGNFNDKFQLLFEAFLSKDERELERLQLGWTPSPGNTLWMGRVHNPIGLWNSRYHHGSYLQLTISRPHIFEFEDAGGPLPSHLLGFMWDGSIASKNQASSGWHYTAALGLGPEWKDEMETANIDDVDLADHSPTATAAIFYKPDIYSDSEIEAFVSHTEIPIVNQPTGNIELVLAGLSFDWHFDALELMGAVVAVENKVTEGAVSQHGRFVASYFQAAYTWQTELTVFARMGTTTNWQHDPYLERFPAFSHEEKVVGLRYEISRRHALKLEFSEDSFHHDTIQHTGVQWSAYFP